MKGKTRPLVTTAAFTILALLILLAKPWRWAQSKPQSGGDLVQANTPLPRSTPTNEAFEQTMIRDIATSSFKEMFDLLRSASPKQRLDWLKQLAEMPAGPLRTVALSNFCKTFVQLDPHAAAESIAMLPRDDTEALAAAAMVGAVPQSAMGEMAAMLIKLPLGTFGRDAPDYLGNVIQDWGAIDPLSAARFLEENPEVSYHVEALMRSWGRSDPEAAKAWLENQPASFQSREAFLYLIDAWFVRDEAAAHAFEIKHADDDRFVGAINSTTAVLFFRSPADARTFLLRLPAKARNNAIHELASSITLTEYDPSEFPNLGYDVLAESRRKPEDIARWMITLPQDSWKEGPTRALDLWYNQDAAGFFRWLDLLPQDHRNKIVELTALENGWLEVTIPLLMKISDPTLRDDAIRRYMDRESTASRDKRIRRIAKSNLSETDKQYLIKLLQ